MAGKNGSIAKFGVVDWVVEVKFEGKKVKLTPPKSKAETIASVMAMTILFFLMLIVVTEVVLYEGSCWDKLGCCCIN